MAVTIFPKHWLFEAVGDYGKYLFALDRGLAGASLLFAALFLSKFWKTKEVLERDFLKSTRHSEKLGLQATIGKDLSALFEGWIGVPAGPGWKWIPNEWHWESFWAAIMCLIALIWWRAADAELLGFVFSMAVFLPAVVARCAFLTSPPSPDRLLLVVDDLDRCEPKHLLGVMESIKLLLEEDRVSRRVQVLMLIEEEILQHALCEKYDDLLKVKGANGRPSGYSASRVVRENNEKLFTAHFRLPALSDEGITKLVSAFGVTDAKVADTTSAGARIAGGVERRRSTRQDTGAEATVGVTVPAAPPNTDENVPLSAGEKDAILTALLRVHKQTHGELGPRGVRSFLFRYQLARLILEALSEDHWAPESLATMIATLQEGKEISPTEGNSLLIAVAKQVA